VRRAFISPRVVAVLLTAGLGIALLCKPDTASAVDLFPLDDIVRGVIGGGASFASDQVAGAAVASLLGVVKFLVGDLGSGLGQHLVSFLLAVPDYTSAHYRALNTYADYVDAIAWGLLGLVLTGSALRYWAAGYSAGSAGDALMALQRTASAAAGLVVLRPGWHFATLGVNKLTWALSTGPGVGEHPDKLFIEAVGFGTPSAPTPAFGGLVLFGMLGCAVWLLVTKVILSAALAVLYLGAPLAIALSPLEELVAVTGLVSRGVVAILAYPVVWTLCFAAFALLIGDGGGGALEPTVARLRGLAALLVAIKLPRLILQRGLGYSPGPRPAQMIVSIRRLPGL
jgi:hypothetical protein